MTSPDATTASMPAVRLPAAAATPASASAPVPGVEGLVLWGAPASGKTGLLGALYATHTAAEHTRWEAHPKDCEDEYTQQRLFEAYEQLLTRQNAKTGLRAEYRPLRLTLREYEGGRQRGTLRLSLVDPAGEYSTSPELGTTDEGRALFRQIATSSGLLWLFDAVPDGQPSSLDRLLVLQHLVALLENAGGDQLTLPVGLCLSKIDCLSPERRAEVRADPRAALIAHLGATTFTWFEAVCPTLRAFAISSAGTEPGKTRPIGLGEPFSWFAQQAQARESRASRDRLRERLRDRVRDGVRTLLTPTWIRRVRPSAVLLAVGAGALWFGRGAILPAAGAWRQQMFAATPDSQPAAAPVAPVSQRRTVDTAAGDVEPERRAERRSEPDVAPDDALRRARRASRAGQWPTVVRLLADTLPAGHPRAVEWDTLLVRGALNAAMGDGAGRADPAFLALARDRATRAIEHGPAGSRALAAMRYARATACLHAPLGCPLSQVREDLTWTLVFGQGPDRAAARRVLLGGRMAPPDVAERDRR